MATGVVLVLLTGIIQVIVFQYGKGTVRAALDEAAALGRPLAEQRRDLPGARRQRARRPARRRRWATVCKSPAPTPATASSSPPTVHFDGWFGSLTDYDATLTASAAKENQ